MSEDACRPVFHTQAVKNIEKSAEEGRPIFENEDYVQILIPGNSKDIIDRRVQEKDKERWPAQWAAYQNNKEQPLEGTPITVWPELDPSQVATLSHKNIRTVEDLASLPDVSLGELGPGALELQKKAQRFLKVSEDTKLVEKQESRIAELEARIAELESPAENVTPLKKAGK